MAENDGSVAIGLSLDIKNLRKDIIDVQTELRKMTVQFKEQGQKAGTAYVEGASKGIVKLNKRLNDFVASMKDISPKMGKVGEKIASQFSKPLLSAVPKVAAAFSSMLPVIGLVAGAVALAGKAVDGIVNSYKELSENSAKAKAAQTILSGSLGETSDRMRLQKEILKTLNEEAKKATGLKAVIQWYKEGLKGIAVDWFKMDKEKLTSAKRNELLAKSNDDLRTSQAEFAIELDNIDVALGAHAITAAEADKRRLASAESYLQKLIELRTATALLVGETNKEVEGYDRDIEAQRKLRDEIANTVAVREADTAYADYEEQLRNIAAMESAMSGTREQTAAAEKQANQERQSANEAYLRQLIEIRNNLLSAAEVDYEALDAIRKKISAQAALLKDQRNQNAESGGDGTQKEEDEAQKKQEAISKAYEKAEAKRAEAIRMAEREREQGLITEIQLRDKIQQAMQAEENDMKAIVEQYGLSVGRTVEKAKALEDTNLQRRAEIKALDEEAAKEEEIREIMTGLFQTRQEQLLAEQLASGEIETQIEYENKLLELTRERERAKLDAHLAEIGASEEERESVLADFDKITQGMIKAEEAAEKADDSLDTFFASKGWQTGMQVAAAAVQTFTDIANAITQAQVSAVEEQVAKIDKMLDEELKRIEKMRQKALEEAGFAEAATQESLQAKMDAAEEAGDQILAYEYQRRMEEKAINDRFDAQAEAAEKEAKMKKGQLEYEAAIAEWETSKVTGTINGALAVLQALSSANFPLNFVIAGLVGAAAVVQQGIIADNPPPRPSYESGGIVPGASFSGDNVLARVNSGERILTMDQQEFMLEAAGAGAENQTITVVVPVYLDGEKITEVVADNINSARVLLEKRGIKGL